MEHEHNLLIESIPNGFRVFPSQKGLGKNYSSVECVLGDDGFWDVDDGYDVPMYSFYSLVSTCMERVYLRWNPRKDKNNPVLYKLRKWAVQKSGKAMNHLIHEKWKDTVQKADPFYSEVHRKLFSISGGKGSFHRLKQVKSINHLKDIAKYKAAGVNVLWGNLNEDWMSAYCPGGTKYRSMNRTLMNLPGNVNWSSLPSLEYFRIPEPATTRLKLMAYCVVNEKCASYWDWEGFIGDRQRVILRSSEEDIKNAIKFWWHYFPDTNTGNFRKTLKIMQTLREIFDYPEANYGNIDILGLAKRSEVYHHNQNVRRRMQQEEFERRNREYAEKQKNLKLSKTKLPPIPLPDDPKIKFLSSYKEVEDEGEHMDHCVQSYAELAVNGDIYLFHVDHNNEEATVEVRNGFVAQARGPRNSSNSATEYAEKVLGKWAKGLLN